MLVNGGKPLSRGLDLRSPQTKFNLMRKLQQVKESNEEFHSSDGESQLDEGHEMIIEENHNDEDEELLLHHNRQRDSQVAGFNPDPEGSHLPQNIYDEHGGVEMRAVNNYSRLFINNEDEDGDDESQEDCILADKERGQSS